MYDPTPAPAISVEGLSKRYRLRRAKRQETLRDALTAGFARWRTPLGPGVPDTPDAETEFWALRNISFQVARGDVVGIVGRNGAGKSTLLKILSRITEPTHGRVRLNGRVSSLLEVGTGFHPELSGRENVYLNGSVLGLSRAEIKARFDEIVAFADVDRFMDTPVKHYSSGMQVRLAFAVAAHLDPEILIVDEVLAVGDVAFQKKCLGKMNSIAQREGRTVLFVSHNLSAIRQLCRSGILLNAGQIERHGTVASVLDHYTRGLDAGDTVSQPSAPAELQDRGYLLSAVVEDHDGKAVPEVSVGQTWQVRVRFRLVKKMEHVLVAVGMVSAEGIAVQTTWSSPANFNAGDYEATFTQSCVVLAAGSYSVLVGLSEREQTLQQVEAARLHVTSENTVGYYPVTSGAGLILNGMTVDLHRLP